MKICLGNGERGASRGETHLDLLLLYYSDPRCHTEPHRPVLEPSPGPTGFPPPPGQYRELPDPVSTPPPPCSGKVSGFKIYDLDTNAAAYDLVDGATVKLSELPEKFTLMADASGVSSVSFYLGDALLGNVNEAPYLFQTSEYKELYMEGTYTFLAKGDDDVECSATVTMEYGNPYTCEGIVEKFILVNTETGEVIDSLLDSSDNLDKATLPEHMTVVAVTNGRGDGEVHFAYNSDFAYSSTSVAPYAISGSDTDGNPLPWSVLNEVEVLTISAWSSDALGTEEAGDKACQITLQITQDWECPYTISSFSVMYAGTNQAVPGYSNVLGHKAIDLHETGDDLSIQAHSSEGGVRFYVNGKYIHKENAAPYAINGDSHVGADSVFYAAEFLRTPGRYVIEARLQDEDSSKKCSLTLTVMKPIETIDNDEVCGAEMVVPDMVGNHMPRALPFEVTSRDVNETVTFKTKQTITSGTMDWVTTAFVTKYGISVCDKIENMGSDSMSDVEYTTKCYDGFAYVDIYAFSSSFNHTQAHADVSMLADGCKGAPNENVIKYTYVFPCDCDVEVPDELTGGIERKQNVCAGATGGAWGDPHIIPLNANTRDNDNWNCQGVGEFIMAQADLVGFDFDFEMRARFTKFHQTWLPWSFHSAIVAKQEITVQVDMAESQSDKSLMMENVPMNLYVDGVQRSFAEGSGDHRVSVTVSGFEIFIGFATTGITVNVQVRPFARDDHSNIMNRHKNATIPGSLTSHVCFPDDNENIVGIKGLVGTPTQNFADDFMEADGTPIDEPSNKFDYCVNNWCVTDPSATMFTFEDGFSFADYDECGTARRERRELTSSVTTCADFGAEEATCQEICSGAGNYGHCVEEYDLGGAGVAALAIDAMVDFNATAKAALSAPRQDDAACCSDDFKTCDGTTTQDRNFCGSVSGDGTFAFLEHGPNKYLNDQNEFVCAGESEWCTVDADCCWDANKEVTWSMTCDAGACKVKEAGRRLASLEDFQMVRPDLSDAGSFVPLKSLGN